MDVVYEVAQERSSGSLYVMADDSLLACNYSCQSWRLLIYSEFSLLSSWSLLVPVAEMVLIAFGNQLQLLDVKQNISEFFCSGEPGNVDGNMISCRLFNPKTLLLHNNTVFIGTEGSVRTIPGE